MSFVPVTFLTLLLSFSAFGNDCAKEVKKRGRPKKEVEAAVEPELNGLSQMQIIGYREVERLIEKNPPDMIAYLALSRNDELGAHPKYLDLIRENLARPRERIPNNYQVYLACRRAHFYYRRYGNNVGASDALLLAVSYLYNKPHSESLVAELWLELYEFQAEKGMGLIHSFRSPWWGENWKRLAE